MKAYALTDIGKTRKVNQDAQFASTEPVGELSNLFVVADGMGGHQAGDFASRYLIEHMPEYIKESGENEPVAALRKGIEAVNQELYTLSCEREELAGMGTTLVAASIQGNTLYVANVGGRGSNLMAQNSARTSSRQPQGMYWQRQCSVWKRRDLISCATSMMKWCLKCRREHPRWKKSMRLWRYALTGVRGFRLRLPDLKVRFTRKIRRNLWEDATGKGIRIRPQVLQSDGL